MSEMSLFDEWNPSKQTDNDRYMTIKEVSEYLGVSRDIIEKRFNEAFPGESRQGVTTKLTEPQVTALKLRLQENSFLATSDDRRKLANMPKTELEKELLIMQAMQLQQEKIIVLQTQLSIMAPKAEAHDALMKTDTDMSITQASKHFGLHPKTQVFPYLREHGYLTSIDLPTQQALDLDIMAVRQSHPDKWGKTHSQAVVKARQLDRFRKIIASKFGG